MSIQPTCSRLLRPKAHQWLSMSLAALATTVLLGCGGDAPVDTASNQAPGGEDGAQSVPADCGNGECTFSDCHTPAFGADQALWGSLQPTDTGKLPASRDTTSYSGNGNFEINPWWQALDAEGGWIFTVANLRLQTWNTQPNPGNPTRTFDKGFSQLGLTWTPDAHAFDVFQDIDAPPGNDSLFALVGGYGVGVAVYDSENKASPLLRYQDVGLGTGRWAYRVATGTIGGQNVAFVGARQGTGGVFAYDLDKAVALNTICTDRQPSEDPSPCPGVFLGQVGDRKIAWDLSLAGNYLAVTSSFSTKGFEIYDVSNPAAPVSVFHGLDTENTYAVALWSAEINGSEGYAITVQTDRELRTYDLSCLSNGANCSLGAPLWTQSPPSGAPPASNAQLTVTAATSSAPPYLYSGYNVDCLKGDQFEWLFDVSDPATPRDLTPPGTQVVDGQAISYWGWYYRPSGQFGFNRVQPRRGKVSEGYFYRAAESIFDIHQIVDNTTAADPAATE
ncbi:MAG: hypothetical protein AAGD01_00370 [Acidobacteriota bacterium]